jgi:hypothetical protein
MLIDKIGNLLLVLLVFLLFAVGYVLGDSIGTYLTKSLILYERRYLILLYRPAHEYIFLYDKLNDVNELKRLSGYYSLLEYKTIDNTFLIDRYKREKSPYIKRTIIWILGYSEDSSGTIDFFSSIYKDATPEIQLEILRSVKRMDGSPLKQFIINQKVPKNILKKTQ